MKMASLNATSGQSAISETAPRPDHRHTLGRKESDSSQFLWLLGRSISNLDASLSASCIERVIPVWAWCNRFGKSRRRNYLIHLPESHCFSMNIRMLSISNEI